MQKKLSLILFLSTLIVVFGFFSNKAAMAAGDCSDVGSPDTCWNYDLGFRVVNIVAGEAVTINGKSLEKYEWSVTPKNKNAYINNIVALIEKDVIIDKIESNGSQYYEPCFGAPTLNIGVGDCLRQAVRWTPNFSNGLYSMILYVTPTKNKSTGPIFLTASTLETGSNTLPSAAPPPVQISSSTFTDLDGNLYTCYYYGEQKLDCKDPDGNSVSFFSFTDDTAEFRCGWYDKVTGALQGTMGTIKYASGECVLEVETPAVPGCSDRFYYGGATTLCFSR